jgi:hypothetical protein
MNIFFDYNRYTHHNDKRIRLLVNHKTGCRPINVKEQISIT